jgi:hypothetical protein
LGSCFEEKTLGSCFEEKTLGSCFEEKNIRSPYFWLVLFMVKVKLGIILRKKTDWATFCAVISQASLVTLAHLILTYRHGRQVMP